MTNQHTRKTTKESIEIEDTNTHSRVGEPVVDRQDQK